MERNRGMLLSAREVVRGALGVETPAPAAMLGTLASIPLPAPRRGSPAARLEPDALATWFRKRGVESVFFAWPGPAGTVVRLSAQLYNAPAEYALLANLLVEALDRG